MNQEILLAIGMFTGVVLALAGILLVAHAWRSTATT
jgi:Na+-transporting NADH:ubiquinone oxidoreductase subunit NqrF